ncbi:hypothetical protein QZH41_016798, partial [Actinostola sp. cb2023]
TSGRKPSSRNKAASQSDVHIPDEVCELFKDSEEDLEMAYLLEQSYFHKASHTAGPVAKTAGNVIKKGLNISSTASVSTQKVINNSPSPHKNSLMPNDGDDAELNSPDFPYSRDMWKILRDIFHIKNLRTNQLQVINAAMMKKNCFVLMPTGGGKSLCYQVTALLGKGVTFVVSPLKSLIQDQVQRLTSMRWGHDFRPDYKNLSQVINKYKGVPVMALTATATPRVRTDVENQLRLMNNNCKRFCQSFNRPNLKFQVFPKKKTLDEIITFIKSKYQHSSGIVYCLSRNECERVADTLKSSGIRAGPYHAGLGDKQRVQIQETWIKGHCKVVCATIAFGMGIDKGDVRFVIHFSMPKSLEGYYQECGRAGRDGKMAECILFYSYGDMHRLRRYLPTIYQHPTINLLTTYQTY